MLVTYSLELLLSVEMTLIVSLLNLIATLVHIH